MRSSTHLEWQRSWTLQEAALAVKLDIVFADRVLPPAAFDSGGKLSDSRSDTGSLEGRSFLELEQDI